MSRAEHSCRVSVVIPCYNGELFLREAVDSVMAQSLSPLEIIVVDDGSTDETANIAGQYGTPVRVHRFERNAGKSVALNWAVPRASGEFVMILDADDVLAPHALGRLASCLQTRPTIAVAFGHASLFDASGEICARHPVIERTKGCAYTRDEDWRRLDRAAFFEATLESSLCPLSSTLFRKSALDAIGPHNELVRAVEDWEMFVRLSRRFDFAFLDEVLSRQRRHECNISSSERFGETRYEGMRNALVSVLESVELTKEQRAKVYARLVALKIEWAKELVRAGRSAEARNLFHGIQRDHNAVAPSVWRLLSLLPPVWLRGLRGIKQSIYSGNSRADSAVATRSHR